MTESPPQEASIGGVSAPSEVAVPPLSPEIPIEDFLKVDLRVAVIEVAERLPKSKKLLRLSIDLGSYGKRQILSGIAQFYEPENLVGRKIIVVANLKPAALMGERSEGMLLAGSPDDNSVVSLAGLDTDLPAGARVR